MIELLFKLETEYLQTGYAELKRLCEKNIWYGGKGLWWFKISDLERVEAILGKPIEFTEENALKVLSHSPCKRLGISLPEFKGKSGIKIVEKANVYVLTTWSKKVTADGCGIGVVENKYEVPNENVKMLKEVIMEINELQYKSCPWIPVRSIGEKICKALNIDRFNRQTGSFDWEKFYGCRASGYHPLLYFPLKVLVHQKYVEHRKDGMVRKLQRIL